MNSAPLVSPSGGAREGPALPPGPPGAADRPPERAERVSPVPRRPQAKRPAVVAVGVGDPGPPEEGVRPAVDVDRSVEPGQEGAVQPDGAERRPKNSGRPASTASRNARLTASAPGDRLGGRWKNTEVLVPVGLVWTSPLVPGRCPPRRVREDTGPVACALPRLGSPSSVASFRSPFGLSPRPGDPTATTPGPPAPPAGEHASGRPGPAPPPIAREAGSSAFGRGPCGASTRRPARLRFGGEPPTAGYHKTFVPSSSGGVVPRCNNCEAFVTEQYVRVFAPDEMDTVRVCPHCEDKLRDGNDVREARAPRQQ